MSVRYFTYFTHFFTLAEGVGIAFGSICLLLAKLKIFQVYWSVDFVILSVCLSVCLSPTGHNFKPIFTKLQHMVEFVIRKKPIVFEVKRST